MVCLICGCDPWFEFKNKMKITTKLEKIISKLSKRKLEDISPWKKGGDFAIYKIIDVKP